MGSFHNFSRPSTTETGREILLRVLYSAWSQCPSQEKWVDSEFACFVRLSIVFFECYFKLFLCLLEKAKKFSPPGFCHEPRPAAAFCAVCVWCSYNLGTSTLPMSTYMEDSFQK